MSEEIERGLGYAKMLKRIGNSYGIIIDRPIMDLLGIDEQTPLEITAQDGGCSFVP